MKLSLLISGVRRFQILIMLIIVCNGAYSQPDSTATGEEGVYDLNLFELMNLNITIFTFCSQKMSDAPSIISAYTQQDIEKMGVTSFIDVLKYIPGIETSMDNMGNYRVSIRGIRKDGNILLLIDGVPANNFYDGKAIYDLPTEIIERVEVIRGPGSALFGTNAVAGVINVITTKIHKVSVRGGVQDFAGSPSEIFGGDVHFFWNKQDFQFSAKGGYADAKGANTKPFTPMLDEIEGVTNRWLKEGYLQSQLKYHNLNISVIGFSRNQGPWVGPWIDNPLQKPAPSSEMKSNSLIGSVSYDFSFSDKLIVTPKVYTNYILHDNLIQKEIDEFKYMVGNTELFADAVYKEKYKSITLGTELQANYQIADHWGLITGIVNENSSMPEFELERNYYLVGNRYLGEFTNLVDPTTEIELYQAKQRRSVFAYYLQTDYNLNKFAVTLGYRFDNYSDFGSSHNPRLGLVYKALDNLSIKMLYGQAFRAPTFKELYDRTNFYDPYGVIGNEELKPENLKSAELGIEYSQKYVYIRANSFYTLSDDIIGVYDPEGGGKVGSYENIGNINSFGVELETTVLFNNDFNLFVNASYFEKKFEWLNNGIIDVDDINYLENRGVPYMFNIPKFRVNAGANYTIGKFKIFAGANWGSAAKSNNRSATEGLKFVEIEPYLLANLSVKYSFTDKLSLQLLANNLGNIKYSDPEESTLINKAGQGGMAQPTSTLLLKVSYKF